MAKRIKVSGSAPRGLSKTKRQIEGLRGLMPKFDTDNAADRGWLSELIHIAGELKKGPQATPPSSTRKKLVKEGNRKFIGPRQVDPSFQMGYAKLQKLARENPNLMEPRGSVPRNEQQLGLSRHKTYRGSKKIKGLPEDSTELDDLKLPLSRLPRGPRKIGDPKKSIASDRLKRKLDKFLSRNKVDF
jgi:hypothetical protein